MAPHLALPFAAFILAAAPAPATAPASTAAPDNAASPAPAASPQEQVTDPQILAIDLGQVIGAAQQCTAIDKNRVASATAKAKSLVASAAHAQAPDADANRRFDDGVADGQDAIVTGETNCTTAEASLHQLEQQTPAK
jgi:hypothetical protein